VHLGTPLLPSGTSTGVPPYPLVSIPSSFLFGRRKTSYEPFGIPPLFLMVSLFFAILFSSWSLILLLREVLTIGSFSWMSERKRMQRVGIGQSSLTPVVYFAPSPSFFLPLPMETLLPFVFPPLHLSPRLLQGSSDHPLR